ncbi:MAG: antirestriction protein ArdA [Aminipila sp.]
MIPCNEEEIDKLCEDLDISNNSQTSITVDSVYMDDRANVLLGGKTVNLDKLNYLAKRLDSFGKSELTTFYAVAYGEKLDDIDSLINLTFNTHCASVVSDFSDLEAIGKDMYLTERVGATVEELDRLDGQTYFERTLAENPNPMVTPYGIIYRNQNQYEQVFDGIHFPEYYWKESLGVAMLRKYGEQEYLYLPFEETELRKAMERLGVEDIKGCEVELDSEILTDEILMAITEGEATKDRLLNIAAFSKRFTEVGISEKSHFDVLVEHLHPKTEKDLNAILDNMYEFEIFQGICSAAEYGKYMICDSGHFEYDENLEEYIDFERYGNHKLKYENGAFLDDGYLLYHGYNMELRDMLEEIGIEVEPQEAQVLKLYMPLKGSTYYDENGYGDFYQTDYEMEICPEELADYEDEILEALEKNALPDEKERGLMKYYSSIDSVNAKVKRYDFSVENVHGKLMGIATLQLNALLDDNELEKIKSEISGQASDGFGEGFEQREINCNGKEIFVSFWHSKNWSLQTAEELGISEQKQELTMGDM